MTLQAPQFQSVGETYHDFVVTNIVDITELQAKLIELVHTPTGAEVMHIQNDDPENLFCLSFRTHPDSSNGVAHILEHTVLCGSKNFPVKDPFFAMTRRSLNTFMNALTGADFTCYPAASQVPKDFYNLLEVYLDAVFRPNLHRFSFLQEGHRLEFAEPTNPKSPLEYKGIVFNEMKGAMASPSSRLLEKLNEALFPNITYQYNSGGDPKDIPKLTYEELLAFHKQYYHPGHCLFFFYGDIPLERHLDFIAKNTLNATVKMPPLAPIPSQPRFKEPKHISMQYPIAPEQDTQKRTMIAFGWLTCHALKQQEILGLSVLEIALMDTDASPLKMALLKSGLCTQASCYMETDTSEAPAVITLKGCNPEHADQLELLLKATLEDIAQQGISEDLLDSSLHQLELYRSEITGDHSPFGLSLFMRSALLKQHGAKPEEGLVIHALFDRLRKQIHSEPEYLPNLIRKYFLDNPHFVRVVMEPSKELAAQEEAEEKEILEKIHSKITEKETQNLIKQAQDLEEFQLEQENVSLDVLPKITLDDVPKSPRDYPLSKQQAGNLEVYHHDCFTNDIVYTDLIFPLPHIPEKDLSDVRLFSLLLSQMGSGGRTYAETLDYMQAHTGGVGASISLNLKAADCQQFTPSFHIRSKALRRKLDKLFPFIHDIATSVDFTDITRLKEVILKHATALVNSLNQNAMKYAINLSASKLDVASKVANHWYGLTYFHKIKELADNFDKKADELVEMLQEMQQQLMCLEAPHLVLSCNEATYDQLKQNQFYGLQDIETNPYIPWKGNYPLPAVESQGRVIAAPVAFTGKVFNTISYNHPDTPALTLGAGLLDNVVLHKRIREQGGAYGGGAVNNSLSGHFYFYSYRDPNIVETTEAFEDSIQEILDNHFEDSDIEEAKLEIIQALDAPIAPGSRAGLAYSWLCEGKTYEMRQAYRNKLLSLTREEILGAIQRHIIPNKDSGATVVFAGKDLLEKENALFTKSNKSPLPIKPV